MNYGDKGEQVKDLIAADYPFPKCGAGGPLGDETWSALNYAVPVLGLKTETARTWGDGRPVPIEWDPNGVGNY